MMENMPKIQNKLGEDTEKQCDFSAKSVSIKNDLLAQIRVDINLHLKAIKDLQELITVLENTENAERLLQLLHIQVRH